MAGEKQPGGSAVGAETRAAVGVCTDWDAGINSGHVREVGEDGVRGPAIFVRASALQGARRLLRGEVVTFAAKPGRHPRVLWVRPVG